MVLCISRSHILNPVAQAELHTFLDQLPLLLTQHTNASTTSELLENTSTTRIQIQYEAENLIKEYEDFKNQDSEYREDAIMDDAHGERGIDETKKALHQTEFEMKT